MGEIEMGGFAAEHDLNQLDFLNPDLFLEGIPHDAYRWLRDHDPVAFRISSDGPYWLLTRHEDVYATLLDAKTFSSEMRSSILHELTEEEYTRARGMIINMDPPHHTRYRRIITRSFAARALEHLEPRVRDMTHQLIDSFVARGECDLVDDFAAILPINIIFDLLGVPEGDRDFLGRISKRLMFDEDPKMGGGREDAAVASFEMFNYCIELTQKKLAQPTEDLTTMLLQAEVDGERLTQQEVSAFFLLLVIAGHETTRALLPLALHALMEHPMQMARLRVNRQLLPTAVEEMLRWVSPVLQFRRTAARDVDVRGRRIRAGDRVVLAHSSANFDERVFKDPRCFDLGRSPNPHISFGVGPHLCLGAALARMEARIAISAFLDRLAYLEPAGPVVRVRSPMIASVHHVPVRFVAAQ